MNPKTARILVFGYWTLVVVTLIVLWRMGW